MINEFIFLYHCPYCHEQLIPIHNLLSVQAMHELVELERNSTIELTVYDTFDETATYLLDSAVEDDMRIFIVISDEISTRNTLCEVSQ